MEFVIESQKQLTPGARKEKDLLLVSLFVPTFEENGIFMLGEFFFIQSILTDRNNSFRQNFFIAH